MSRAPSILLLVLLLTGRAWAADRLVPATLMLLEQELLERPAFEASFYDLLAEALAPGGWESLDKRWEAAQGRNRRFLVLRGMLAERQGRFDNARKHYAAARVDEWGAYHHARLLAFLGETATSAGELRQIADRTSQRWLFREAVLGLGELTQLQHGSAAAERLYAQLWDKHPRLEQRIVLMEPLLCLRTEAGTAASWLGKLQPKTTAPSADASEADLDQGVLWSLGTMLSSPEDVALPAMVAMQHMDEPASRARLVLSPPTEWLSNALSHPDAARWHALLQVELGWRLPTEQPGMLARHVARRGPASDVEIMHLLQAAAKDPQRYVEVATAFKAVLRNKPGLLAPTLLSGKMVLKDMYQRLTEEVFEGITSPVWTLLQMHMQRTDGAAPGDLADKANRLWQECRPGRLYLAAQAFPEPPSQVLFRTLLPANRSPGRVALPPGPGEPTIQIIWNLRGKTFTDAMRAQFALELQERHHGSAMQTPLVVRDDGSIGSISPAGPNVRKNLAWSEHVRAYLWHFREALGLKAPAGPPGSLGETLEERIADVLIRGNTQEASAWLGQQPRLADVQPRWLLTALVSVGRSSTGTAPPRGQTETRRLAQETIRKALQSQQPAWLAPVVDADECPYTTPAADAGEQQALLATRGMSSSRMARQQPGRLQAWEKMFGRPWTAESLAKEAAAAFTAWETNALPHPLWGLAWSPSLRRQQTIVRAAVSLAGGGTARYLTEVLPRQLENEETAAGMPQRQFARTMFSSRDRVLSWIVKCYGTAVLRPSSNRAAELASWAQKLPRVNDLLALWQVVPAQQMPDSPRPMMMPGQLSPHQHSAFVKILERSTATDAQFTLAMMHWSMGDPAVAHQIAAKYQGKLGPLRMLALELDRQPREPARLAVAQTAPPVKQDDTIEKARRVFSAASTGTPKSAVRTLHAIASSTNAQRQLYDWLLQEVKAEPAWSLQIKVLAELARRLKLSEDEITVAEQLDLRVNPQDPAAWLHRGVSYSRQGKDDWAVDLFIEAVRRTDFADPSNSLSGLTPMKRGWLDLAEDSGRMDELSSAFGEALEKTPVEAAERTAAKVLTAIVNSRDAPLRKARLERLGRIIVERQRCLVLRCFDTLVERTSHLDGAGHKETAILLARLILQGIWKQEGSSSSTPPLSDQEVTGGPPYLVFASWGTSPTQIHPKAPIDKILQLALRGEDAQEFTAGLMRGVARFPQQEQIISCALVAQAIQGPLSAEHLKLAGQLGPQARMRVAWRLCEHAPEENVPLAALVPMIQAGLSDLVQDPTPSGNIYALFNQVIPLTRWLQRAGGNEAITELLPAMMATADGRLATPSWEFLVRTCATHGTAAQTLSMARQWRSLCLTSISQVVGVPEWSIFTTASLLRCIEAIDEESGNVLAAAAFDVWKATLAKLGAEQDPPAATADNVGMALLETQQNGSFEELLAGMADIEFLGHNNAYRDAIKRLQACSDFLNSPDSVPQVHLSLERMGDDETTAELRWEWILPSFAPGQAAENSAAPQALPARFLRNGSYEIEVHARQLTAPFRPITHFQAAARTGVMRVTNLPPAGWLMVQAHNRAHGTTRFEEPVIYSLRAPLLASRSETSQPEALPQWTQEQMEAYGSPISTSPPMEAGATLLVTLRRQAQDGDYNATSVTPWLVALNEQGQPLRRIHFDSLGSPSAAGDQSMLLDVDKNAGHLAAGAGRISRLAMTRPPRTGVIPLARMQAQFFDQSTPARPTMTGPSLLESQEVAKLGFKALWWHLSASLPRAAFADRSMIVVYDTTEMPWKELLRHRTPELGEHQAIFVPNLEQVCVLPSMPPYPADASRPYQIKVLRCDGRPDPAPADKTSIIELPFTPIHLEMSPDERSMIFIAWPFQGHLKAAWLDARLHLSLADLVSIPTRWKKHPTVAWWPDNKSAFITFDGDAYQAVHTGDSLQFQRLENSPQDTTRPPAGATPGAATRRSPWVLRAPDFLLQVEPASQKKRAVHQAAEACTGQPMTWRKHGSPVLLQSEAGALLLVRPPEPGHAKAE